MDSKEKRWFNGAASAIAAALLIIMLSTIGPIGNSNVIYAMEQALKPATTVVFGKIGNSTDKPRVEVPVDLKAEEGDQKNADAGHSPWKLDPIFVSQVFVSLKISPEGITGDYPIKYQDIKLVKSTGNEAVAEISGSKTPIRRVYLKRVIRQDNTGIWTVVGYDPAAN